MRYLNARLFSASSEGSSTIYRSNSSTWALSRRLKIEKFNMTFQDKFLSIRQTIYSHKIYIFFYQQKTDIIDEGKVPRSTQEVDKRDQPKRN